MVPDIFQNKLDFFLNKRIRIYLKHDIKLEGELCGFDQFMNLSLKDIVIFSDKKIQKQGLSLLRGNIVLSIQPLKL